MKKFLFFYIALPLILVTLPCISGNAMPVSPTPLHETRAVWLTTIGGIDWPHTYARSQSTIQRQQEELCTILDRLQQANINTVLFQTRIRATTVYPSQREPWDACLTGHAGEAPGYDPLAFAINECHKRGMQLHAWVVAIPIGKWNGAGCKALRKTHPKIVKKIGDEGFINPEVSESANYIASLCRDLTARYDIDGIHLDYIRYPDQWKSIRNRLQARENITRIVRAVSSEVKGLKPWVALSCSPVGKYADTRRASSHGWNARDIVCQDAALWMREGLMDAIFPMMYFRDRNFYPFAIDWQERSAGAVVAPGLGIYFMHPREGNWRLTDITQELQVLRAYGMGNCMFRSKFFTDNTRGIYSYYKDFFAPLPSLPQVAAAMRRPLPHAPRFINISHTEGGDITLRWDDVNLSETSSITSQPAISYNIYGSATCPVDTEDAGNLLAARYLGNTLTIPHHASITYYAVTAVDRYGNESVARQTHSISSQGNIRGSAMSSHPARRSPLPVVNGSTIYLNANDAPPGTLVQIASQMGTDIASCIAGHAYSLHNRSALTSTTIDVSQLPAGHYSLYLINKKGHRHHLGIFSIPITKPKQ